MALSGISTIGAKFGFAIETTAGTKPTEFTQLTRINTVAGITLETEQIDASSLEDLVTSYIGGRQDTGGTWAVTVNLTPDTIAEWKKLIEDSETARKNGLLTWFEVWSPYLPDGFFVVAEPPAQIPLPEFGQNALQTVEMSLTINKYKGLEVAIEPKAPTTVNP